MNIPFHKSLSSRLLLALTFIAMISVGGLGLAAYNTEQAALEAEVKNQLTSIADLKKEQIITWLDERKADARLLAVNRLNQDHLTEILSPDAPSGRKLEFAAFLMDNLIGMQQSRVGYTEIAFIDTEGKVIVATDPTLVGRPTLHKESFIKTLAAPDGMYTQDIHIDPRTGSAVMAFGHVIHAIDLDTGQELSDLVGMVQIIVDMEQTIYPLIRAWPGMGETGETLLVRAEEDNILFLNNLRFDDNAALELQLSVDLPDVQPVHMAALGTETIRQSNDYRGVPVLAAFRHIPGVNWGFIAKKDIEEAFAPVDQLNRRIGVVAAIVLVLAGAISLAISRTLTRPLAKLVTVTQKVAGGNWNTEIDISSQDEIGALADSFKAMIASLEQRQKQVLAANEVTRLSVEELRQADKALRESEERLRSIYNAANDAILLIDPDESLIIEANPKASEMFGYPRQQLGGMPVGQLHPEDVEQMTKFWETILQNGTGQSNQLTCLTKSGKTVSTEASFSLVQIKGRSYILAMLRDVTKRKQLETQLRQSQKMEAIGQLAGGVAHDFNNLLTVINGYSELLASQIEDEALRQDVGQIKKAGESAARLTRQLLAFSRKQVMQPKVLDLNAIITDTQKMLRRLISEDIELVTDLESPLGRVKADPGQIEQVLLNLAVNARDAMPQGGKLTIKTSNVSLDAPHTDQHIHLEPGRYIVLSVSDTGMGMAEETQARIFEPFFTTKEFGQGTGLGLATVYGIVTQSGGAIDVDSKPEQGATFKIYLPEIEEVDRSLRDRPEQNQPVGGSETILLVEDEAGVRRLARDTLERGGYCVIEAQNGCDALKIANDHEPPIHLLLTDIVMPTMNGHDLAKKLVRQHPETKVIYVSGYADRNFIDYRTLESEDALLQKPFTPQGLMHKIRTALDN